MRTVNPPAPAFEGSNPSPTTIFYSRTQLFPNLFLLLEKLAALDLIDVLSFSNAIIQLGY
jgi:hypothetical protein